MSNTKQYWNSLEQLNNDEAFIAKANNEFAEELPVDEFLGNENLGSTNTSRRDFLKFVGFSVAAATLAACEAPVIKSIPYVNKPEEITPGVANYYASTYYDGTDFASVLVKTREGRPIHIESNKLAKLHMGGLTPRVNASVLGLYDSERQMYPSINGEQASWKSVDDKVTSTLESVKAAGGNIRILTNTIISPSTKAVIKKFEEAYGANVKTVTYDAYSYAGMRKANKAMFGKAVLPNYKFDQAKVIVSLGADFLSTWLMANSYSAQYALRRNPDGKWMNKHYQFESNMSLTGTNADVRAAIKPSEIGLVALELYNLVGGSVTGKKFENDNAAHEKLAKAAKELKAANGHALVVCGVNDPDVQMIVNAINEKLGAYNHTIDLDTPTHIRQGDDEAFAGLVKEMKSGAVDALLINGVNPVYTAPAAVGFAEALKKVKFSVSFADRADETASLCTVIAPDNHYLESWNDYNPVGNYISFQQPTINALFDTRQMQDSLLRWSGINTSYYDFMKSTWEGEYLPATNEPFLHTFWNKAVHDGVYELKSAVAESNEEVAMPAYDITAAAANVLKGAKSGEWEVEFYLSNAIAEGNQANNPWLQELPDPVSKMTWDNYIAMNQVDMERLGFATKYAEESPADMAKITVNGYTIELPVIAQPGQKIGAVSIALGYGRTKAGKVVEQGDATVGEVKSIGQNLFNAITISNGVMKYSSADVSIEKTENTYPVGSTQTHHTMMGRKIINETSLKTYKESGKEVWNPDHILSDAYGNKKHIKDLDLWEAHDIEKGHRWGLSVDLNACLGCGACVIACHSENNVPVVGKDEVRRTRTMSWLRIDRYFSSDMTKLRGKEEGLGKIDMYGQMEDPSAYPEVAYQPVMCQHCNHAPCETVCPVAATTHSNEGMNQMTYNRCIGTRYCANNCPYKVRRFNWFNYVGDAKFTDVNPSQSDLAKMVLNPDVVVRARGVMEKCSFCVQRIQAGKLEAKKAGRPVEDGEVTSACASACTTGAIYFGDLNDKETKVRKSVDDDRAYNLLEEIGTKPNVYYMTKVRNVDEERIHESIAAAHPHASHEGGHEEHGHEESHGEEAHQSHEENAH